jgi:hypothetical protein
MMSRYVNRLAALLLVWGCLDSITCADGPIDFVEVAAVKPSRLIDHEVDVKGPFDEAAVETFLIGPQFFSQAVSVGEETVRAGEAYLNWYQIAKPTSEPRRRLRVRDALRAEAVRSITIGDAAFLLSPAKRVGSGPPRKIPEGLGYFKAYTIMDDTDTRQTIRVKGGYGGEERKLARLALVALPVAHWHHDEHTPAKDLEVCLLVYELDTAKCKANVTTIDQFGLNTLHVTSSRYLAVPGVVEKDKPAQPQ